MCKVLNVTTANGNIGLEIYFEKKPIDSVLDELCAAHFRWHRVKRCWYHKDDDTARGIAAKISNGAAIFPAEQNSDTHTRRGEKRLAPLWERTRTDELHPYGGGNPLITEFYKQANASGGSWDKYCAAYIRKHLRERFPEVKFSVTSGGAGYLSNVDIYILSSPYGRERIFKDRRTGEPDKYGYMQNSTELEAVYNYCNALHDSFDADDGDHYADYGAHHDLYGRATISSNYEQTEPTEEQRADIAAFEAAKQAEDERQKAEEWAQMLQAEREREEAAKRAAEEHERMLRDVAEISAHVEAIELAESEQLAITALRMGIGKETNIAELDEEIARKSEEAAKRGEDASTLDRDAVISRKVLFSDKAIFDKFCNMFIYDFAFLSGKGGSATEDVRMESLDDYFKLTAEQRETLHTYANDCVGVYFKNVLQFVIDPQGYNYARYVMRPTERTEQRNATDWRAAMRKESEHKAAFYIPAPLSEQLKTANLQPGEDVTMLILSGWTCSVGHDRGRIVSATPCEYAQHKDAARIEYIPRGKRNARYFYIANEEAVIYRGTLPEIPENMRYTDTECGKEAVLRRVNYSGNGAHDYIRAAIKYYEQLGYTPVIDTVQR